MKRTNLRIKLSRYLILGIMFVFCVSLTIAQEFDTDVPMGWAVVPGYAGSFTGQVTTTGGAGGEVVTATSGSQLASYASGDEPRIILVQGTLSGSDVNIGSNKTIIGAGANAKISGFYLNMNASKNIIIRNLTITGGTDGIAARYTDHLWIDHCKLYSTGDGLIDITRESDRYTISWCVFSSHHKTMLLNGGSTHRADEGKLNGTVHHCWFNGSDTRNPRAGFGKIHVFNSLYNNNGYCIGLHSLCRVVAEKNYFINTSDCIHQMYTSNPSNGEYGSAAAIDNVRINCSGDWDVDGNGFTVGDYYMHSFTLDPANDVQSIVKAGVGPSAKYASIGLMPTPGQGAVKVSSGTLKWASGTVSASSYKVYFGTTPNPSLVATTSGTSHNVSLSKNTVYYWRVDQVTSSGVIPGKLWVFTTGTGIVNPDPVTGVTVSPTSTQVGIGSTMQLEATVLPVTAGNKNVSWSSSNTAVATVDQSGVVTGVSNGSATITVTTAEGSFTATCIVTVKVVDVTGVSVSPTNATVGIGGSTQLTATVKPTGATNQKVSWGSSNTAVATVSSSGVVTGVSKGSAIITVTTDEGSFTATCNVTVSETSIITIQENETGVVSYDGSIDNNNSGFTGDGFINTNNATGSGITWEVCAAANGTYTLEWRYSNGASGNRTAQVDVDGSVAVSDVGFPTTGSWSTWSNTQSVDIPLSSGVHQIRLEATNSSGLANIDYITVAGNNPQPGKCLNVVPVTGITLTPVSASVSVGGSAQLTAIIKPSNATNQKVSWASDKITIATVSSSGLVSGISEGSATITVTTDDGGFTAKSTVTVKGVGPQQYALSTSVNGNGSVSLDPPGGVYDEGTVVSVTAVPASGWLFDNWSGALSGSENPGSILMDKDQSVTANFSENQGGPCENPLSISVPFSKDGKGVFCWVTSGDIAYINSWNMKTVEVNGVDFTNKYASGSDLPGRSNGNYYIYYDGLYSWSHFEATAAKNTSMADNNTNISLFPNPFSESANLVIENPELVQSIVITDQLGRIVEVAEQPRGNALVEIGTSLETGMYFIQVLTAHGMQTMIMHKY